MKMKKVISLLLALILTVSMFGIVGMNTANAASNPYFTNKKSDSITQSTAHVHALVKNPSKATLCEAGCVLKTKSGSWSKTFVDKGFSLKNDINLDYYIGKSGTAKGVTLSPNTSYTYQFYVKIKGHSKAIYSGICNFTTKADTNKPTFSALASSNITYNDAKVSVKVNNPAQKKITEVGVKVYSTNGDFSKTLSEKQNLNLKSFDLYYLMSKNNVAKVTLPAGKTYKFQFYIKANGYGTLYSGTGTFVTPKKPITTQSKQTYPKIKSLRISRIYQPKNDHKNCYKLSCATAYAYKYQNYRTAGKDVAYNSTMLNNWSTHNKQIANSARSKINLQLIYNNLKAGTPVVIYYNKNGLTGHASVIIGYNGNTSKLEEKGFIVMEIKNNGSYLSNSAKYYNQYANSPQTDEYTAKSCYIRLDSWLNYIKKSYPTIDAVRLCVPTK